MGSTSRKIFQPVPSDVERVGKVVLDAAYAVHSELGPGLLKSVYQVAMKHVIQTNGVLVETEVKIPYTFRGVKLESGLRLDMLVEPCVIAELKSVEKMNPSIRGTANYLSAIEQSPPGLFDKFLCASSERRY